VADCHAQLFSPSRRRAEKLTQARYPEILHKQSQCAGLPLARFWSVRVNVRLIRIDRFSKSPVFDTFWPREHGERSKKKKVDSPYRNTSRYIGRFFPSGQTSVAGGSTKTRLLVKHGFPVTDSIIPFVERKKDVGIPSSASRRKSNLRIGTVSTRKAPGSEVSENAFTAAPTTFKMGPLCSLTEYP
jgi:hypothetical protein